MALLLFRHLDRGLSRAYITESVWGNGWVLEGRTLDAHISQIRRRLGLRPEFGLRLEALYAFVYRLHRIERSA